jgi:hypothetical protein
MGERDRIFKPAVFIHIPAAADSGFKVAFGCLSLGYQQALWWLWDGFEVALGGFDDGPPEYVISTHPPRVH